MQIIIHFIIKNTEFSITVNDSESIKILSGNVKIKKIKSKQEFREEILEYWIGD